MKRLISNKDFPSTSNFTYLNTANVGLMLNKAEKFEFSTIAFGCALGFAKSIDLINDIGVEEIFKYNRELADILVDNLCSQSAVITSSDKKDRSSIVTAYFKNKDSNKIVEYLCKRKVHVSTRGNAIRFSPHLYNNIDDIINANKEINGALIHL